MTLPRRTVLGAGLGLAALATPLPLLAAGQSRVFDLYRGDNRIGGQTLTVTSDGDEVRVSVDIKIRVRIMGLPAYSYDLSCREVWVGGTLQRLDSEGNDNGTDTFVRARRTSDGLSVEASGFNGRVTGKIATTSYWTTAFLDRTTWLSTQDGRPLSVSVSRGGTRRVPDGGGGEVEAQVMQVRGEIPRLDLFYDDLGEWVGSNFDARGHTARFVLDQRGRNFAGLWTG